MFNNIICIPSIKEFISYTLDYFLGIKLNLSNFSLDDNNNVFIQLTNVSIDANRMNNDYLQNINIKIIKGIIGKIEIRVGLDTFEIKISKLSIRLMPYVTTNKNQNNKNEDEEIEKKVKKEEQEEKEKKQGIEKNNNENKKGVIKTFIEYFIGKLKVSIEEIELISFNYEINNKNLIYANPVITFNIYNINYDKNKNSENSETNIRKNIWESKHFSIGAISLRISKSFSDQNQNEENNNIINDKDKDKEAISINGSKKFITTNFDKDNNDNIMLINYNKGIHIYTNDKNEILAELGDIQLVINLFQLELLKNFIDTYSLYLNTNNEKNEKEKEKIIESSQKNEITNIINPSSSSVIEKSNNEVMNAKLKLNSFSIVLLGQSQDSTEMKFYEFEKDKMTEHFCYFEDNFMIFILYNLNAEFDNKREKLSITMDEISCNYIEYISKTKKEEEIEMVQRTGSEYSECNESLLFKDNEIFRSMESNNLDIKEYYRSYYYKYNKNQMLLIKNINFGVNFSIDNNLKISFELNSLFVNVHPIYLFKLLKILYDNSYLIKEILFYNYEQISNGKKENNNDIDNANKEKENESEENVDLSFLSCEEFEKKEEDKKIIDKEKNNNNKIIKLNGDNNIYSSELLFGNDNENKENKEKGGKEQINEKIKNILKTISIEVKIKTIELKINSFKCDESFYNIINPFFIEFYYDHICIMDVDNRYKKLKIDEISSSDYFNVIIKNLNFKNEKKSGDELLLKFGSVISSFNNNKMVEILSDTYPVKYDLDANKIFIDIKINVLFIVKLLPFMLSFINIWNYTLLIFGIFQQRMLYNYNKGKEELCQMNFEKDILDYFKKIKSDVNDNYINKNGGEEGDKVSIEINIRAINVYFDIIKQKIKALLTVNNINLKYAMDNNEQNIEFSISKIESNEFKSYINDIRLGIKMTKLKNKINLTNSERKRNIKNNLNLYMIVPERNMEIYIENILRLKERKEQLNDRSNKANNNILTDIKILVKDIQIQPLESILYVNDIYNVIIREEIYTQNNNNNYKRKSIFMSMSSTKSDNTNSNELIDSLIGPKKNQDKSMKKDCKGPLFTINLDISSIKFIINEQVNERVTEIDIENINFKNSELSCETIAFFILYEPKDFGEKVKADLGNINNIKLEILEKINYNLTYHIVIDEISFAFCKDSFTFLQQILDDVGTLMSNCFVSAKKSNKIVITKKDNKVLNTYDIDENQSEQESELFGNNVAKSICLISDKNEFTLDIDENYLDNLKNEKEEPNEIIDELYKEALRERKKNNNTENDLNLTIKNIIIGLYGGTDFETTVDIQSKSINDVSEEKKKLEKEKEKQINKKDDDKEILDDVNQKIKDLEKNYLEINNDDNDKKDKKESEEDIHKDKKQNRKASDNFEVIDCNFYKKISAREKENYLLLKITNISLSILYEKKNSYEIEFMIEDLEIVDNLINSTFKRLFSAKKNIEQNKNIKNKHFLFIFVDISNSQNELSTNEYNDYNITCEISLSSSQLMVHQNSLLFVLDFFINNKQVNKKNTGNNDVASLKLYNLEQYHTKPSFVLDSQFNQIFVEDFGEEQNDLIEDKNFFYITNFIFREFEINITYESNDLGFRFQNIYIPLIPDLKGYTFSFNRITYKGFVTLNKFTDYFTDHFVGQLSKYNIFIDLLKSLSWTKPIINILEDFVDIFVSPFQSYRKNQGFIQGLFKGLKKFFFNLLSKNVYVGEKMIRTLTTFIGVTKNNNIGKNSFYEKYILTDEKKKIYDYFYK